jgi:flagellar protein FlaG
MIVPTISAAGRSAETPLQANPPQAPLHRLMPVAATRPAGPPDTVVDGTVRTGAQRSQQLDAELAAANRKLADDGHQLRFEYDHGSNQLVVRLVDLGTQKVLSQYPSDQALRVARALNAGKPLISSQA